MHDMTRPLCPAPRSRKAVGWDTNGFWRSAILIAIALVWLIGQAWMAYVYESRINRDGHRKRGRTRMRQPEQPAKGWAQSSQLSCELPAVDPYGVDSFHSAGTETGAAAGLARNRRRYPLSWSR
jgi:hypothetical protein